MNDDVVEKPVEVSQMIEPQFLTLTGLPANQVAFKVLRTDEEKGAVMATTGKAGNSRKRARSDGGALLYFEFTAESEDADISAVLASYGIPEGYEVSVMEDGRKRVKCSDAPAADTPTMCVTLSETCKATVIRSAPATDTTEKTAIKVVALEFKKEKYANEVVVRSYLETDFVDLSKNTVENFDTVFRVSRSSLPEDTDMRRIEIVDGVVAVVVRAEVQDVPLNIATAINETAYGNYGWGQLDFAASMADVIFCDVVDEATYRLGSVLRNILFYSELPLSSRKDLVARATSQFSAYVGNLIDSLPTQVVAVSRSDLKRHKEFEMSEQQSTTEVTQTSADAGATVTLQRSELEEIITSAIRAALPTAAPTPATEGTVARTDAPAVTDAPPAADTGLAQVQRSVAELVDLVTASNARIAALEATTVVRSDVVDSGTVDASEQAKPAPFQGVFRRSATTRAGR